MEVVVAYSLPQRQAGFIAKSSHGDMTVSNYLRHLALRMMNEHPAVWLEEGLSVKQWIEKKQTILNSTEWGGDLEVCLLAIRLHRDIVVITAGDVGSYVRRFPQAAPLCPRWVEEFPLTCEELCTQWPSMIPPPLVIIFNGSNHYDLTLVMQLLML